MINASDLLRHGLIHHNRDHIIAADAKCHNLTTGKRAAAESDFKQVMAQAPDTAGAVFGHSLVLAMAGDKAGSRTARIRALDLDPDVPEWIEKTFRFFITAEYRER